MRLDGRIWPGGAGLTAPIACPQRRARLSSPAFGHSSRNKKVAPAVLRCAAGPTGAGRSPPAGRSPSRPRWARPEPDDRRQPWRPSAPSPRATTATPARSSTLSLNAKAQLVPAEKRTDKAPDFRIFAGNVELGAAWKKTARETGRDYLSVKLDDPSFPAPIYASLVEAEAEDAYSLIWSR